MTRCSRSSPIRRPINSSSGAAWPWRLPRPACPLHVHAELHDTIDAFLDQIEAVNKEHPIKNLRWTLAHVNQINAAQLERMKKLGMYAAVHPWAVINGGIMHEGFGDGAYDMPPLAHDPEQRHPCGDSEPTGPRPINTCRSRRCILPSPARWRAAPRSFGRPSAAKTR